jgi:hypothetical protein
LVRYHYLGKLGNDQAQPIFSTSESGVVSINQSISTLPRLAPLSLCIALIITASLLIRWKFTHRDISGSIHELPFFLSIG